LLNGVTRAAPTKADGATPADEVSVFSRTVFNIAGNKHRIVVWINYPIGLAGTASTSC
jgi:mRNA-degrading endonuclease HigB of HigAB toxin-antitoxin module